MEAIAMRQRELLEPAQNSRIFIPETIETQLIELLAQLMIWTLNAAAAPDQEKSDEPDQR
jgi:hypothetical protein